MSADRLPPRPFSPFLRLLIGAAATLLVAEWARFQADVAWAALPVGAGAVMTLAAVGRGMRARRTWRHAIAAARAAEAARSSEDGLPVPQGAGASPLDAAPHEVEVRRRAAAPGWPAAPLIEERDLRPTELGAKAAATRGERAQLGASESTPRTGTESDASSAPAPTDSRLIDRR